MKKINRVGETFTTNEGCQLVIVAYKSSREVTVQFQGKNKYTKIAEYHQIVRGKVKNPYHPGVEGIGFLGEAHKGLNRAAYKCWKNMLRRCYSRKCQERFPTYKSCSVHPIWHNFSTFCAWYEENVIEGFQLDKDYIKEGNKTYGPDTCCFLSPQKNTEASLAKDYTFTNPEGERVEIFNLTRFCRENNLDQSHMWSLSRGIVKTHKGWTVE